MRQPDHRHSQDSALRQRAEAALRFSRQDIANMPAADIQQLVYELQVHQIELDLQNDELQRVQHHPERNGHAH